MALAPDADSRRGGVLRRFCRGDRCFSSPSFASALPFLLIVTLMFLVGIYDDLRRLNPATKLIGQIASAAVAIYFGYRLHFLAGLRSMLS